MNGSAFAVGWLIGTIFTAIALVGLVFYGLGKNARGS